MTSAVAIILVFMFFISGADANTYVLGMMTSGGSLTPRRSVLILWGVLTGITAVVLMLAGGLNALQNTVIVASLPFLVIIAGLAVAFWKDLATDLRAAKAGAVATVPVDELATQNERETTHVQQ